MTDNTKANRKRTKEQIYKTFSRKFKIEQNVITKNESVSTSWESFVQYVTIYLP